MTNLSKILDWAKIFGEIKIFMLNMSAVVKNDKFEQNPVFGPKFLEKLEFSSTTCPLWSKMTILIENLSALGQNFRKNSNFHPSHVRYGEK